MSSESASQLASEAKGIHQGLKELLKTRQPWDKEVEINRKNLRRLYLCLLLLQPYTKESNDAETHLWMQTSYQFISIYKQNIATLDRTLQQQQPHSRQNQQNPQQNQNQQSNKRQHTGHGPVEYRKLMQRFRQFLAEEEKFWIHFVARYHRSFSLHEAYPALVALSIVPPQDSLTIPGLADAGAGHEESNGNDDNANSRLVRDHHGLPPEDAIIPPLPLGLDAAEQHSMSLAILAKALVCLGDIARYRELYNESGGRPKAGHEDGVGVPPARRGRHRRGGVNGGLDMVARARNYERAISYYEHARTLVPQEGNAAHQLAILAFYQGDVANALYWYYRALCVKAPYEAALGNLRKVLGKVVDGREKKAGEAGDEGAEGLPTKHKVERMKENIVLLHALLHPGPRRLKIDPDTLAGEVTSSFEFLVSERALPIELVTRIIVLSQGALWKHRMIRETTSPRSPHSRSHSHSKSSGEGHEDGAAANSISIDQSSCAVESRLLMHILALHRVLLEIGTAQLATPPQADVSANDLAQRITATFRRTLPALRVASKWLVGNLPYVLRVNSVTRSGEGSDGMSDEVRVEDMSVFWVRFAEFYTALRRVFPTERLPRLGVSLDEDVDLRGFLPLRGKMGVHDVDTTDSEMSEVTAEKVHPNEEQLMRIYDLVKDAQGLADTEGFPVHVEGSIFVFDGATVRNGDGVIRAVGSPTATLTSSRQDQSRLSGKRDHERRRTRRHQGSISRNPHRHQHLMGPVSEGNVGAVTDIGPAEDDPVGDAFRKAIDDAVGDDDDDEDEIVWNPKPSVSPPTANVAAVLPTSPLPTSKLPENASSSSIAHRSPLLMNQNVFMPGVSNWTTSKQTTVAGASGTTAEDLLNNVMGKTGSGMGLGIGSPSLSSATAISRPPLLFGSGSHAAPSSIWSTCLDQQPQHVSVSLSGMGLVSPGVESGMLGQGQAHTHDVCLSGSNPASAWSASFGGLESDRRSQLPAFGINMTSGETTPFSHSYSHGLTGANDRSVWGGPQSSLLTDTLPSIGTSSGHHRTLSMNVANTSQSMHRHQHQHQGSYQSPAYDVSGISLGSNFSPWR